MSSTTHKLLNPEVENIVTLAHDFSELMHGAHIAYNVILQTKAHSSNNFSEDWSKWIKSLQKKMLNYSGFSPETVLSYVPNLQPHTHKFVLDWWDFVNSKQSLQQRDDLIEIQEFKTKGYKARIHGSKYDDVSEDKWIGLGKFEYRLKQVKTILKDVFAGLEVKANA